MGTPTVVTLWGVQVSALEGRSQLAIILVDMMVVVAPAAQARAKPRMRAQRGSWTRLTPSSRQIAHAQRRGLVIVHGLVALFLGVIALVIILLVIGLGALWVLVVTSRAIMGLIVSMMIVGSAIVMVALVASMVVVIFTTRMLLVAWFTAMRSRKMSRFLFLWLLLILGNLLENARWLVSCLTLLKESNHLERFSRHHFVQVRELVLVCLGLHKEDFFALLLHHGYFHCSTEVATLEVAEKLYSTPHELVHWHKSGLLGCTKPANQLVAYIWETSNSLKVSPDALIEVCLCTICIVWALLCNDAGPLSQAYVCKALTHETNQQWTIILLRIQKSSQNLWLEIGEHVCEEVLRTKSSLVRHDMTGNLLGSFLEGDLDSIGLFQTLFD
jgi:hypothetical protein